ncbi:hypothetical protein [Cupriavidus basilensis]|uniref:hypothetical protein n=1 Tax=Cupriavidus basilensis TaxID=68895 RepID=UPI003F5AE0FD
MHERVQPTAEDGGRNLLGADGGAEAGTAAVGQTKVQAPPLMEAVVEKGIMWLAYRKVVSNGGAAGVDALAVTALRDWLTEHWPSVKAALLAGQYIPQAVRAVDIPKPAGGVRTLGHPDGGGPADPAGAAASSPTDL